MRARRRGRASREWVLTIVIAGVPSIIVVSWTESVVLGAVAFAATAGICHWLLPSATALPKSPPHKGPADRAHSPEAKPAKLGAWTRFRDRMVARRRKKETGGFRTTVQPRRCIHCRYDLTGLPDYHDCPECGQPYTFTDIDAYFDDPDAYREAHK